MLDIQAEFVEDITQNLPTDRDVTPIDEYRDRAVLHVCGLVDGLGNICEGYQTLSGNDTIIRLFRVDHTTGQRTPIADVSAPPGFKMDDFHFWQSGSNVLIGLVAHEAISSPTRRNIYARALVPGVLTPYPGGSEPRGAYIDPALLGGSDPMPNPEPTGPTLAEIRQVINEEIAAFGALFGSTGVRGGIQEKVMDGLRDAMLKENRGNPRARAFQDALTQFMQDRVYETVAKFLDPKPGTPPQEPS